MQSALPLSQSLPPFSRFAVQSPYASPISLAGASAQMVSDVCGGGKLHVPWMAHAVAHHAQVLPADCRPGAVTASKAQMPWHQCTLCSDLTWRSGGDELPSNACIVSATTFSKDSGSSQSRACSPLRLPARVQGHTAAGTLDLVVCIALHVHVSQLLIQGRNIAVSIFATARLRVLHLEDHLWEGV